MVSKSYECAVTGVASPAHMQFKCRTVIEEIAEGADELDLGGRSVLMRAYASWFNFTGADQQKNVGVLSGGERNRLQLAKVTLQPSSLLAFFFFLFFCR